MYHQEILAAMETAARKAGDRALRSFRSGQPRLVRFKAPGNPLAEADEDCDTCLHESLITVDPDATWFSEESKHPGTNDRIWIVDPIDGTKEFLEGLANWCIMIAYVVKVNGIYQVVCAVVHLPVTDELFAATKGQGATMNGKPINVSDTTNLLSARLAVSRSELHAGKCAGLSHLNLHDIGSTGVKMCRVASGNMDACIKLGQVHKWDVAAPMLIAHEARGVALDLNRRPIAFDRLQQPVNGHVTAAPGIIDQIFHEIAQMPPTS